jgi:phosphorylcholine metabolism protein LicD
MIAPSSFILFILLLVLSFILLIPTLLISHLKALSKFYFRHVREYKYFSEIGGCGHYDARFFNKFMTLDEIQTTLHGLFREWHGFCASQNVTYFLGHGTLLGWWWGRQLLSWDTDLDLQMTLGDMVHLYRSNNDRNFRDIGTNGDYLLEFNLNFMEPVLSYANVIDMRFIHHPSGLFIDITNVFPVTQDELKVKLCTFFCLFVSL